MKTTTSSKFFLSNEEVLSFTTMYFTDNCKELLPPKMTQRLSKPI